MWTEMIITIDKIIEFIEKKEYGPALDNLVENYEGEIKKLNS